MMKPVTGLPEGTVGVLAEGRVSAEDYRTVLLPAIDEALLDHEKIRLYFELGSGFEGYEAGAFWEDSKLGVKNWTSFEKVAVVTDTEWIRHGVHAFRFMIPASVEVFGLADEDAARIWLAG